MRVGSWICLFILVAPVSSACSPGVADWWFAASLSVSGEPSIPGLTVTVEDGEPFDALRMTHDGDNPVYVGVERESDMVLQRYRNTYGNNGLSYPLSARFKLDKGRVHAYDEHHGLHESGRREGGRWRMLRKTTYDADLEEAPARKALELSAEAFQRVSQRYFSGASPEGNLRRDNRSDNVSLPGNHSFSLRLRHGGEQHNLSGIVSYSLNQNYDRWQRTKGIEACREFNKVEGVSWFTNFSESALVRGLVWWLTGVLV